MIVVPLIIGIAAGIWIDSHYPSRLSWTIMLMFGGLCSGCISAWKWIKRSAGFKGEKEEEEK